MQKIKGKLDDKMSKSRQSYPAAKVVGQPVEFGAAIFVQPLAMP